MCCVAITLSKWDLMEQKRKEEEAAAARKQASYDDIDGRSVYSCYLTQASCLSTQSCDSLSSVCCCFQQVHDRLSVDSSFHAFLSDAKSFECM